MTSLVLGRSPMRPMLVIPDSDGGPAGTRTSDDDTFGRRRTYSASQRVARPGRVDQGLTRARPGADRGTVGSSSNDPAEAHDACHRRDQEDQDHSPRARSPCDGLRGSLPAAPVLRRPDGGCARRAARRRPRARPGRRQQLGRRPDPRPSALDGERVRRSRPAAGPRGPRRAVRPGPRRRRHRRRRDRRRAAGDSDIAGRRGAVRLRPQAGLSRPRARRTAGPRGRGGRPAGAARRRRRLEWHGGRALHRRLDGCRRRGRRSVRPRRHARDRGHRVPWPPRSPPSR